MAPKGGFKMGSKGGSKGGFKGSKGKKRWFFNLFILSNSI